MTGASAESCDIVIVGAGMAGASLAASLAGEASVIMLEAEDVAGYHATGRSAAFWEETYGGPQVFPLTVASGPYLREGGFLTQRGALHIGRAGDAAAIDAYVARFKALGAKLERLDHAQMARLVPGLKPEWVDGTWSESCCDIDVGALHAHFLSRAQAGAPCCERGQSWRRRNAARMAGR